MLLQEAHPRQAHRTAGLGLESGPYSCWETFLPYKGLALNRFSFIYALFSLLVLDLPFSVLQFPFHLRPCSLEHRPMPLTPIYHVLSFRIPSFSHHHRHADLSSAESPLHFFHHPFLICAIFQDQTLMSSADMALWSITLGLTTLGGPREEGDKLCWAICLLGVALGGGKHVHLKCQLKVRRLPVMARRALWLFD